MSITRKYLELAAIPLASDLFLFRSLVVSGNNKYTLSKVNKPICYSTARSIVLEAIKPFVADISEFGTHSFRRGGASSAAASGVDERLLMGHGRWASSKSKDLYVVDPVATKMSVSSSLGI